MNKLMNNSRKSFDKKAVIFTVILFALFGTMVYLFPYSGDDWAWGSQIGLNRLESWFTAYNGRYAGNLVVLALTRSELLNIVVTGVSLVCVCLFPKLFASSRSMSTYVFGTMMFLLVPREIFVQSVVWTAGYSNYVPPILLTVLYFILIKNIFDEDKPQYSLPVSLIPAVIGFVSGLFMENVTLYNVAISALIILFVLIRFRRVYLIHIMHFVGCVAGALTMFTNSAYGIIANGDDGYRTTALEGGIADTIVKNSKEIFSQFFSKNVVSLAVFSLLCIACGVLFLRRRKTGALYRNAVFSAIGVNVLTLMLIYCKSAHPYWVFFPDSAKSNLLTTLFFVMIAGAYFASAVIMLFLCVDEEKAKYKLMLLLISIPVLIAPLAVVTPIGPRCFFPPYMMLIAGCVMIFHYLKGKLRLSGEVKKGAVVSMVSVCVAVITLIFSIYVPIHAYDVKRNEYVKKQADAGFKNVVICRLPYTYYVWVGDPEKKLWADRYKLFYGIDRDVNFKFISRPDFDDFVENFEKGQGEM